MEPVNSINGARCASAYCATQVSRMLRVALAIWRTQSSFYVRGYATLFRYKYGGGFENKFSTRRMRIQLTEMLQRALVPTPHHSRRLTFQYAHVGAMHDRFNKARP
jgi:hypothetical protein